jgi:hypothetical protein
VKHASPKEEFDRTRHGGRVVSGHGVENDVCPTEPKAARHVECTKRGPHRGVIKTIKVNTFRQVIIGSRDDTLVVHTAFQGVEKLTLEQLAQGQDVLFGYYRFPKGSPQPSGFYAVKIIRDTQSGEWLAQFRNMQGQVVILRHASVGVIKPAVQALRLLVEIAPVGGVTGSDVLPDGMGTGVLLPQGIAVSDGGAL